MIKLFNNNNSRDRIIDIIKGLSIIMIIDVHIAGDVFFKLGQTYHIVSFFVVSGLLNRKLEKYKYNCSFKTFFISKIKSLIYPYITLSIIYVLLNALFSMITNAQNNCINMIIKCVSLQGIGVLWFLPVMFFAELMFFYISRNHSKLILQIITFALIIFLSPLFENIGLIGLDAYGIKASPHNSQNKN